MNRHVSLRRDQRAARLHSGNRDSTVVRSLVSGSRQRHFCTCSSHEWVFRTPRAAFRRRIPDAYVEDRQASRMRCGVRRWSGTEHSCWHSPKVIGGAVHRDRDRHAGIRSAPRWISAAAALRSCCRPCAVSGISRAAMTGSSSRQWPAKSPSLAAKAPSGILGAQRFFVAIAPQG